MSQALHETKVFYERNAQKYIQGRDPHFLSEQAQVFADHFLRYQKKNGELLDLGCANALRYPSLKQYLPHAHYMGVDVSQALLNMARVTYPCLTFLESDITDWDTLPKKEFSGIWCSSVLQHVPEELFLTALSNLYRLLTEHGVAYISLPESHVRGYTGDTRHFTILTPEEQREFFHQAGFKILNIGQTLGFKSSDIWYTYIVQRA